MKRARRKTMTTARPRRQSRTAKPSNFELQRLQAKGALGCLVMALREFRRLSRELQATEACQHMDAIRKREARIVGAFVAQPSTPTWALKDAIEAVLSEEDDRASSIAYLRRQVRGADIQKVKLAA
jgi:hypothetical protein